VAKEMISYHTISDKAAYKTLRFLVIKNTENAQSAPYFDSAHLASIGIGFNLTAPKSLEAVLKELGVSDKSADVTNAISGLSSTATAAELAKALDKAIGKTFTLTDDQMKNVFESQLAANAETAVNNFFANIPDSDERAALVSLGYNNPALLGTNLHDAIADGQRAEAWFQIRYLSNGGTNPADKKGISKRRYYESQIFGLYQEKTDNSDLEYREIFQMYTRHSQQIIDYDNQWDVGTQYAVINKVEQPNGVANANNDYAQANVQHTTIVVNGVRIEDLGTDGVLHDAAVQLVATYAQGYVASSQFASSNINQIFAAGGSGDAAFNDVNRSADKTVDLILGGNASDVLVGGSNKNIIFGGVVKDTIIGGKGNDILVAGTGSGTVEAGAGNDTLYLNATVYDLVTGDSAKVYASDGQTLAANTPTGNRGATTLIGGAGNDTFYIGQFGTTNGSILVDGGTGGQHTVNFQGSNSGVNFLVENGTPSAADEAGQSIILRNVDTVIAPSGQSTATVDFNGAPTHLKIIGDGTIGPDGTTVNVKKADLLIDLGDDALNSISKPSQDVVEVQGVATVDGPSGNTTLEGSAANNVAVNLGNGDNAILNTGLDTTVNLGNGTDVVDHAGEGSVVNVGQGVNTINAAMNDVEITGATAQDIFTLFGIDDLTGASGWKGQQSPWVTNALDGVSYAIDSAEDLVIDFANMLLTVTGYGATESLNQAQDIGHILLDDVSLSSSLLLKLPSGIAWLQTQFQFVNAESKATDGHVIYGGVDPLVFDLTGAGINLTAESSASPVLDMNGNGFAVHSGWIGANDGVLVLDNNGSDTIVSVDQMLGGPNANGQNGFAELGNYDSNLDGVIDASDPIYSQLRILVGGSGGSSGELLTLQQAGIASINLAAATQSDDFEAGNQILATGSFTRTDGSAGAVDAVSFQTDNFDSTFTGNTGVSALAATLPDLKGRGTLTDLQVAMTNDPALADPSLGPSLASVVQETLPTLTSLDLATLPRPLSAEVAGARALFWSDRMSVGAKRARESKPTANQPARRPTCFARPTSNCGSVSLNVVGGRPSAGVFSQAVVGEVCGRTRSAATSRRTSLARAREPGRERHERAQGPGAGLRRPRLPRPHPDADRGPPRRPHAGMAITAEIKTGSRRVIEYLLSPLLRYKQGSLRER
jgi:hypothetical protein